MARLFVVRGKGRKGRMSGGARRTKTAQVCDDQADCVSNREGEVEHDSAGVVFGAWSLFRR